MAESAPACPPRVHAGLRGCTSLPAWLLGLQSLGLVAGAAPLAALYRLEAQARAAFLTLACHERGTAPAVGALAQPGASLAHEVTTA